MKYSAPALVAMLLANTSSAITVQVTGTRTDWNKGQTTITARGATKRTLWQQRINSTLYPVMKGNRAWGVMGGAVWVTVLRGEIASRGDSLGFNLNSGKKLWEIVGVDLPIAASNTELLFQWSDHANAYPDLRHIELVRVEVATGRQQQLHPRTSSPCAFNSGVEVATGRQQQLHLSIPERSGCGDINKYSFGDLAYASARADKHFIYLKHQDKCGVFTAKFDWHGPSGQTPVIQPE